MTIEKTLCAQKREGAGKGAAHRLRAEGLVPGVFYNNKGDNILVGVPAKELEMLYFEIGDTTVFNLEIDDNGTKTTYPAFFWDVQKHPYKKRFVHIDYYGVDLDQEVKVRVPLVFTGTARGVKVGGFMETYREYVTIAAKPLDMPHKIIVDVTDMGINQHITIDTLPLPEGARAVYDETFTIVSVLSKNKDDAGEGEAQAQA